MVDGKLKNYFILLKIGFRGFFGWLILNSPSDLKKLRWRIQYGRRIAIKVSLFDQIGYIEVFDVAYYEITHEFSKFKMADRVRRTKVKKNTQFERKSKRLRILFHILEIEASGSNVAREEYKFSSADQD